QVEQHQVGTMPVESLDRVRPSRADRHLEALPAQHVGQRVAEGLLVFDHQHPRHLTASLTCFAGPLDGLVPAAGGLLTMGICRVKVDPALSWLHTVTLPRCAAITCLTIARPRPVPPVALDRAGSTR